MLFLIRETLVVHWGKGVSKSAFRKEDTPSNPQSPSKEQVAVERKKLLETAKTKWKREWWICRYYFILYIDYSK